MNPRDGYRTVLTKIKTGPAAAEQFGIDLAVLLHDEDRTLERT
jgi:hypothetical protein